MIEFRDVSKRYGSVRALDGVSFAVEPGEIFGYIGPNGAGKTTSIKILTGLIREYDGTVILDGKDVSADRIRAQSLLGYLPQEAGFQEWRTVDHALQTFARLSRIPAEDRELRIAHAIALVGIEEFRTKRIVHLSGGTVQKLRLAQAILHNPKILVLDEPMSGLDPASRYQVKEIIRKLATKDRVVFFSSHILSDVENLATRIGILHRGRIKRIGTPAELRKEFGMGTIIEVETRDPVESEVLAVPAVESVERQSDHVARLKIRSVEDLDEAMQQVLARAVDQSLPVRSVRHLRPSLEELYLKLTEGE